MKIIEKVSENKDFLPNNNISDYRIELLKEAYAELSAKASAGTFELSEYAIRCRAELENLLDDHGMLVLDKLLWCVIELERNRLGS